jgi:hypothetical protein
LSSFKNKPIPCCPDAAANENDNVHEERHIELGYKGSQNLTACSLGLSATSQQYFSLRTNQPPATSRNQPAVLFSQNKPAPAISHQPTEQALKCIPLNYGQVEQRPTAACKRAVQKQMFHNFFH